MNALLVVVTIDRQELLTLPQNQSVLTRTFSNHTR